MTSPNSELVTESLKAVPASSLVGLTLFGVGLSDAVLIASLLLIILQLVFLIRDKIVRPWGDRRVSK